MTQSGWRLLTGCWLALQLAACATPQQTRDLLQQSTDLNPSIELVEVPFFPQRKYQCGPAALATLLNYQQQTVTPDDLLPLVYVPELEGSLQAEMLAAARRYRLLAVQMDGSLKSLLAEVEAGNPVLVLQNLGLEAKPFWHYAVVIGYSLEEQNIILRSGEIERLVRPLGVFERTWARSDYWAMVVVASDDLPRTVAEERFTEAAVALEPFLNPQRAYTMYRAGFTRWAGNYPLLMGMANTQLAQGQYAAAERYYLQAIELQPERPESWNNLAYSRLYQGNRQQALDAIDRAIELAPDNPQFKTSKGEIVDYQPVQ